MFTTPAQRILWIWALLCLALLLAIGVILLRHQPIDGPLVEVPTPVAQLSLATRPATTEPPANTVPPSTVDAPTVEPGTEPPTEPLTSTLTGRVLGSDGPVADARVRVHLLGEYVQTAQDGTFQLAHLQGSGPITLTAWAQGHYIASTVLETGGTGGAGEMADNERQEDAAQENDIQLVPHYVTDNPDYDWFEEDGVEGSAACGTCHTAYTEWQEDAHGQAASNYRFLTLYSGTDIDENKSPNTGYTSEGTLAQPDLAQPYYGPGFKLDNPERAGNCATCHTPMAAKIPTSDTCTWSGCHSSSVAQYSDEIQPGASPRYMIGDANEGISCEFCHKIGDVLLEEETGLPASNAPGLLSMTLHRPETSEETGAEQPEHDLFFGPLDDVIRTDIPDVRDSYLPLQSESEFCAACHYGVMGGVVGPRGMTGGVEVYSSYPEWLESAYSDPQTGQTCQECHMSRVDYDRFVFAERGGRVRDYYEISNHHMPGGEDAEFVQSAVTMTATAALNASANGNRLTVDVAITNSGTGHHVPSGTPLRHLILVVTATDDSGDPLPLVDGATLPDWAGSYADQPGRTFAKILRDVSTGDVPTAAYWREIELVEDTRIPALATDRSQYTFEISGTAANTADRSAANVAANIEVQLLYRRAYQQVMEWKAWPDQDITMAQSTLRIEP